MGHRRFESVRVTDNPIDGVAAVARARDAPSVAIHVGQFANRVEHGRQVGHDLAAPVLRDLVDELLAKSERTRADSVQR